MVSKYIDKANGGIVLLDAPAHSGLNIDVDGAHHFLVQMGESYYDATTGMVLTSEFTILASKITWVGTSALPATNVSAGTRQSLNAATADRGPNEVDQWGDTPMISNLAAAVNLVDTDLTNASAWVPASAGGASNPAITEPSPYKYHITFDTGVGETQVLKGTSPATASNDRVCSPSLRLVSGSFAASIASRIRWRDSSTAKGVEVDLMTVGPNLEQFIASVTSSDQTTEVTFIVTGECDAVLEVVNMRAADSSSPAAPFPDGSAAGASVGVDAVKASHTYGANTTFYISRKSYGAWVDSGNPVDAEPVIVEAGAMEIRVNAGGFIETSGGAISTKKTDGNWQTIIVKVGGGNHSIQVDDETPVVAASAVVPSGTTYLCNNTAGTKVDHSADIAGIYPYLSTSYEDTTFISGISAITTGQVLQ